MFRNCKGIDETIMLSDNYKLKTARPSSMVSGLLVSWLQLEKIQDVRNIWAGIVIPSVPRQRQFRAAAILPPLISRSNQNDSRDFVRRFGPLGAHQLRVMQLRLNVNELTLDRKWLYAPLAANSKAITVPFFHPLSIFLLLSFESIENIFYLPFRSLFLSLFTYHFSRRKKDLCEEAKHHFLLVRILEMICAKQGTKRTQCLVSLNLV